MKRLFSRPVIGWVFYDFANSAFATSVLAVIFNVYFAKVLVPESGVQFRRWVIPGESLWGYLVSTVMFFVLVLSPMLGAVADRRAMKRVFLLLFAVVGSIGTLGLWGAKPGHLSWALGMAFMAILGFEMSLIFYNAFLKEIVPEEFVGRVSGWGFALGYIGGGFCLGVNMLMVARPSLFGLPAFDPTIGVRAGMVVVGLWWLLFSIPTFVWVKDQPQPPREKNEASALLSILTGSFRQLKTTMAQIFRRRALFRFLLAYVVYEDGIQTVLLMASIFGAKALGMSTAQLALCFLIIQFVAFIGAFVCGRLADSWSHKKVILITLLLYSAVVTWGIFMRHQWEFWVLGIVVALVMGGSQAASRSFFSLMIPPAQAAEFFSFFSIVGKAASLIGPFVFGVASQFFGLRAGVGSLLIFFIIGAALLVWVDEKRSRWVP